MPLYLVVFDPNPLRLSRARWAEVEEGMRKVRAMPVMATAWVVEAESAKVLDRALLPLFEEDGVIIAALGEFVSRNLPVSLGDA